MLSWKGGGGEVKSYSTSAFEKETTTTTEEDYFSFERSHLKRST